MYLYSFTFGCVKLGDKKYGVPLNMITKYKIFKYYMLNPINNKHLWVAHFQIFKLNFKTVLYLYNIFTNFYGGILVKLIIFRVKFYPLKYHMVGVGALKHINNLC